MGVGSIRHCPNCPNSRQRAKVYQCKRCGGWCCEMCRHTAVIAGNKCPHCGYTNILLEPFRVIARIDAWALPPSGSPYFQQRPQIGRNMPPPPLPEWRDVDPEAEAEEIEFPQWSSAPPGARKLGHEKPILKYSREDAIRALERSNVNQNRPQEQEQVLHLTRYLLWVLKDQAVPFIEEAARDESLPKNVRAFYNHAAQLGGRGL